MRFRGFMRKVVGQQQAEFIQFGPEHFKQAGIGYAPSSGMPILEAHELVNNWNRQQFEHNFVYWLEAV